MSARRFAFGLVAALVAPVVVSSSAHAGSPTTVSTLSVLNAPVPLKPSDPPARVPGLTLTSKDGHAATRWHEVNAATSRGYCLTSTNGGFAWMGSYATGSRSPSEDLDLVRLVEEDGAAKYERTRVHFDPPSGTLTAMARSSVPLTEVARTREGIVVWAFRDGGQVFVLARRVNHGFESLARKTDEGIMPFVSSDGCPFAGARLDNRKPENGSFAQLSGNLPARGTGKDKVTPSFIIDASLLRVARDPESTLSIRVRVKE